MPRLFGPDNPRITQGRNDDDTGWVRILGQPVLSEATTLGDAIADYEQAFAVSITNYDGSAPEVPLASGEEPKYFVIHRDYGRETVLVDIHILRNEATICPKQQLNFPLEPTDVLEFGPLVC